MSDVEHEHTGDEPCPICGNVEGTLLEVSGPMIHAAMIGIVGDLPAIGKTQENKGQDFKFRGIDDVLGALKPLLKRYGVYYVPDVIERLTELRTTRNGGTLYVVHLHIRFTFYAIDGSWVAATAWGEGSDSGDKATPKAHTGAQKSALNAVLSVATNEVILDDPDRTSPEESSPYVVPPEGWTTIEEHDEWKHGVTSRASAMSLTGQGEFAAWWRTKHWKWPLTGEQADEYAEQLAHVEAKYADVQGS